MRRRRTCCIARRRQVRLRHRQRACSPSATLPAASCSPPARSTAPMRSTRCWPTADAPAGCGAATPASTPARSRRRPTTRRDRPDASLADLPASQGQGLRRLRRGPAGQGPDQRHRRRLRRYRAAEALLDRRHGPVARAGIRRSHAVRIVARETGASLRRMSVDDASARPSRRRSSAISPAASSSRSAAPPCITAIWSWARR